MDPLVAPTDMRSANLQRDPAPIAATADNHAAPRALSESRRTCGRAWE